MVLILHYCYGIEYNPTSNIVFINYLTFLHTNIITIVLFMYTQSDSFNVRPLLYYFENY